MKKIIKYNKFNDHINENINVFSSNLLKFKEIYDIVTECNLDTADVNEAIGDMLGWSKSDVIDEYEHLKTNYHNEGIQLFKLRMIEKLFYQNK